MNIYIFFIDFKAANNSLPPLRSQVFSKTKHLLLVHVYKVSKCLDNVSQSSYVLEQF